MTPRRLTRREAISDAFALTTTAALVTACGTTVASRAQQTGSTLQSTWIDPKQIGVLNRGPGERLLARTDLAPRQAPAAVLATIAHITDAHVLDASSPARATFLDRLGAPFESTFRPHEALTAQVLSGAITALNHLRPDAVIQGGDLIDNDQENELAHALAAIHGGVVHPGSGPTGYYGVQLASDPDPFYYRPDLDAPRHPGLLKRATQPFRTTGTRSTVHHVLGDHDILVQGELAPTPQTKALALGSEALWELPPSLTVPPNAKLTANGSPDGPPTPGLIDSFLKQALAGPKVKVPADPTRREFEPSEVIARLTNPATSPKKTLDYHADVGPHVRLIVLDLARRAGGSGGLVRPAQPSWLRQELKQAKDRYVIAVSHQPLQSSENGDQLLALLDGHPRTIAAISGHTHRNSIEPRATAQGGYWLINTASLIDFPQQARAIRVLATKNDGVALQTWMLDHTSPGKLSGARRKSRRGLKES